MLIQICLSSVVFLNDPTFPIDTTHFDIELAFDCFAFFFLMVYNLQPPLGC